MLFQGRSSDLIKNLFRIGIRTRDRVLLFIEIRILPWQPSKHISKNFVFFSPGFLFRSLSLFLFLFSSMLKIDFNFVEHFRKGIFLFVETRAFAIFYANFCECF